MRVENEVTIDAPIEDAWALTIDVEAMPSMSETFSSVQRLDAGPLKVGSRAMVEQPGLGKRTWTVTVLDPPHRFAWTTRLLGSRMTGIHELEPAGTGCRSRLAFEITGWTSALLGALAKKQIAKAIAIENAGLKRTAETRRLSGEPSPTPPRP